MCEVILQTVTTPFAFNKDIKMSAISANTVIELFNSLSEPDKIIVTKQIAQNNTALESRVNSSSKKRQAPTPAALLQKHRLKHKAPAK